MDFRDVIKIFGICLFLLCRLSGFAHTGVNPTVKYYQREWKQKRRELARLQHLRAKQDYRYQRFNKKHHSGSGKEKSKHLSVPAAKLFCKQHKAQAKPLTQQWQDSNYLKSQIKQYADSCLYIQQQLLSGEEEFKRQTAHLFQLKNADRQSYQELLKAQKDAYYLQEKWAREKAQLMPSIPSLSVKAQLQQAQLQQQQLLSSLQQKGQSIPANYQTKAKVRAGMPAKPGSSELQKMEALKQRIADYQKLTDSLASVRPKDSLWFKPNPYKSMLLAQRFKPLFSWQTVQAQSIYPAQLETMAGFRFLFSPAIQPIVTLSYKLGLGTSFQNIALSTQGYGLQAGLQARIYKKVFFQSTAECHYYRQEADATIYYTKQYACVVGLGLTGKPAVFLGYDFLQKNNPFKPSPLVIRFNF